MTETTEHLRAALSGRYRIERELGAGGMARVYLAWDLRHDRNVALKVLRPELAAILGGERFLHEIKTTAHLQHPHILPLHDSGELDGVVFYVMPYVEGESLRDRLQREKQLPVEDAVRIARDVASALDYAHRHGVVHRDIKPENILLHEGRALVADFGIALAVSRTEGSGRMTETGMSLGTPQYMSPEQAMGEREISARSDVYALGCVTYEMLSGDPPFTGSTAQAIVARVLTEPPRRLTVQRRTIPLHVEAAVVKALEKLPADRFGSAAEFAQALANPSFTMVTTTPGVSGRPGPRGPGARLLLSLATAAGLGGLLTWFLVPRPPAAVLPVTRFVLDAVTLTPTYGSLLDVSAETGEIVFIGASAQGIPQLMRRPMASSEVIPIAGATANSLMFPAISPDGSEIAYYGDQQIRVIPIAGGRPRPIAPMGARSYGLGWGPGNEIVFSPTSGLGLRVISASGGAARALTTVDTARGDVDHRWPQVLPDGKGVLFTIWRGTPQTSRVALASLRTGEVRELVGGTFARYADGELVYVASEGGVRRIGFDLPSGRLAERFSPVADSIQSRPDGSAAFGLSRSGTLVFIGGSRLSVPVLVDRSGSVSPLSLPAGRYEGVRVSPDSRRVAVARDGDIWIHDLDLQTFGPIANSGFYPVWSRDSRRVFFSRNVDARVHVFAMPVDRAEEARPVITGQGQFRVQDLSPDGRHLLLRVNEVADSAGTMPLGQYDLWSFAVDSAGPASRWLTTSALERSASFAPDGRWVAYSADESGRDEIYVRPFPGPGGRVQVSVEGGTEPAWNPRGGELTFRSGDRFEAIRVETSPSFRILSRPRTLFSGQFLAYPWQRQYDILPDGQRIVALQVEATETRMTVVVNWLRGERDRETRR